jgi:ribosomal protein S18 acetylase RimI-like enzyme
MDAMAVTEYLALIMETAVQRIIQANHTHKADLSRLLQRIESEDHPDEPEKIESAPDGLVASLAHFPTLQSDSVWVFMAYVGKEPAGLALLSRVPKLDERLGFLYLDELHVLQPYRRRGIGTTLLRRSFELARELGLCGVRLLTRIDNEPARKLYESVGFQGQESMFYLYHFAPQDCQA